jgi:predicted AAA+ superfamily ATPase
MIQELEDKIYGGEDEMRLVLLVGPRASGKTSLVQDLEPGEGYTFVRYAFCLFSTYTKNFLRELMHGKSLGVHVQAP